MAPTTRAAISEPIHSSRFRCASGVMPLGQPMPSTSDQLHPLTTTAVPPRSRDNATNFRPRADTLAPPRSRWTVGRSHGCT